MTTLENKSCKTQHLVGGQGLLVDLFPNEMDRPSKRWLTMQCEQGRIPFIRIGRLIWFNVDQVRHAIATNLTVPQRGRGRRRIVPSIQA